MQQCEEKDEISSVEDVEDVELDKEEWIHLCELRPDAFAHYYFGHMLRFPSSELHFLLYDLIRRISDEDRSINIAIAAPRGNAKTIIISIILPIWCVALKKKKFIFLLSETSGVSEGNLESIKHELQSNVKLQRDFPEICNEGVIWRKESIETSNGIRIVALGSGKQVRGRLLKGGIRPDLILCHPQGTKVMTPNGYSDVSELKVGDKVYNHKWEEDQIIAWKPHVWGGDYFKFQLYGHLGEIEATAGHKFFARKKEKQFKYVRTAKVKGTRSCDGAPRIFYKRRTCWGIPDKINIRELEKGDMVGFPINTKILSIKSIAEKEGWNLNENDWWIKTKEFWKLSGYFLGDGNLQGNRIRIYSNKEAEKNICDIVALFNVLKLNPRIVDCTTALSIEVSSEILSNIFRVWKRNKNSHKVPTRSIEFLDPELQRELILGYIAADGWIPEKQGVKVTSVCLELLEFMQRILLRQGIIASIRSGIKGGKAVVLGGEANTQDKYDLYFRQDAWKLGLLPKPKTERYHTKNWFIEDTFVWRKIKKIKSEYKTDTVYPFTVKDEHTYIIPHIGSSVNCDDIDGEKNCSTVDQRQKHEEWLTKSVMGMRGAGDKMDVLVCGTIIHSRSLLNRLLSSNEFPGWGKYKFQAVRKFSDSELWAEWEQIYRDTEHRVDPVGDARSFFLQHETEMLAGTDVLWPEGDSYYDLMEWKLKNTNSAFFSEKQNQPLDPSNKAFDSSTITYFLNDEISWEECDIFGAYDASSGEAKRRGDYSAIITVAKNRRTGIIYVLDTNIKKMPISQGVEYIAYRHRERPYKKFGVDSDALKMIKEHINSKIPDLNVVLYDLRLNKKKRILRLEPMIRNRQIRFKQDQTRLLEEIELYPQVEHDDGLDALEIVAKLSSSRGYRLLTY